MSPYLTPCPFKGSSPWAASSAVYYWQLPAPSKATAAPSSVRFVASVPSLCGRKWLERMSPGRASQAGTALLDVTAGTGLARVGNFGTEASLRDNPQSDLLIPSPQIG